MHGLHDTNICQSLGSGGLGLSILQNAVREVEQLGRKLVAFAELLLQEALAEARCIGKTLCVLVGWLERDTAPSARERVYRTIGGPEAGSEARESIPIEAHPAAHPLFHLLGTGVMTFCRRC